MTPRLFRRFAHRDDNEKEVPVQTKEHVIPVPPMAGLAGI
jgi:hypothetical protein